MAIIAVCVEKSKKFLMYIESKIFCVIVLTKKLFHASMEWLV